MARVFKKKQAVYVKGKLQGYKPTTNWYIEFADHTGKLRHETAGPDEQAAQTKLAQRLREVALEAAGIAPPHPEPPLSVLTREYLKHIERRIATTTLASKRQALQRFNHYFHADPRPSRLTTKAIGEYLAHLIRSGLSNDSANIHCSHIRSLLDWGYGSGELPVASPAAQAKPLPQSQTKVRPRRALTPEECVRLQTAAEGWLQTAVGLGLYAGLRIDEIGQLEWRDLDLEKDLLTVRLEVGKSDRQDLLPLHQALKAHLSTLKLQTRPQPSDRVVQVPGNPYRPLYQLLERAQIQRRNEHGVIDWHALRHTYITMIAVLFGEARAKELQMLARHASPVTTLKVYVHTDVGRMRDVLARIPDLSKTA